MNGASTSVRAFGAASRCVCIVAAVITGGLPLIAATDCEACSGPLAAARSSRFPAMPAAPTAEERPSLSCGEIAECADSCGRGCPGGVRSVGCLLGCKSRCRAKGCGSAQTLFDALTDCILGSCFGRCMGGPSPGCRRCTETECAAPTRRCHSHRCQ